MQYIITSDCVSCGQCENICPVSAIYFVDTQYMISKSCIGCGVCKDFCPLEAVKIRSNE